MPTRCSTATPRLAVGRRPASSTWWIAVKENTVARELTMTCGPRGRSLVPCGDARVVERVLDAGGVLVGKPNMDALAVGPAGQWNAFGTVENPIDPDRVPGDSSSGSGAQSRPVRSMQRSVRIRVAAPGHRLRVVASSG
jgi:Asp-tRNA(Asn)/Glu-tRNA(Gln) amidotransferase A subunit family amidase